VKKLIILLLCAANLFAASVTIEWKPIKNGVKYRIVCESETGVSESFLTGKNRIELNNLFENRIYFVTVKAIDAKENQSRGSKRLKINLRSVSVEFSLETPEPKSIGPIRKYPVV